VRLFLLVPELARVWSSCCFCCGCIRFSLTRLREENRWESLALEAHNPTPDLFLVRSLREVTRHRRNVTWDLRCCTVPLQDHALKSRAAMQPRVPLHLESHTHARSRCDTRGGLKERRRISSAASRSVTFHNTGTMLKRGGKR